MRLGWHMARALLRCALGQAHIREHISCARRVVTNPDEVEYQLALSQTMDVVPSRKVAGQPALLLWRSYTSAIECAYAAPGVFACRNWAARHRLPETVYLLGVIVVAARLLLIPPFGALRLITTMLGRDR